MSPNGGACATRGHVIVMHSAFCLSPPERGSYLQLPQLRDEDLLTGGTQ
jgi:hypothetical protein